jgi:hypothetical protein
MDISHSPRPLTRVHEPVFSAAHRRRRGCPAKPIQSPEVRVAGFLLRMRDASGDGHSVVDEAESGGVREEEAMKHWIRRPALARLGRLESRPCPDINPLTSEPARSTRAAFGARMMSLHGQGVRSGPDADRRTAIESEARRAHLRQDDGFRSSRRPRTQRTSRSTKEEQPR